MTPDEFGDLADHTLITRLNGIKHQRTKELLFVCHG